MPLLLDAADEKNVVVRKIDFDFLSNAKKDNQVYAQNEKIQLSRVEKIKADFFAEIGSDCNCMSVKECNQEKKLVKEKKWDELNNNFTLCGFEEKVPKYCCEKK